MNGASLPFADIPPAAGSKRDNNVFNQFQPL